jgi:hypothetical protein
MTNFFLQKNSPVKFGWDENMDEEKILRGTRDEEEGRDKNLEGTRDEDEDEKNVKFPTLLPMSW